MGTCLSTRFAAVGIAALGAVLGCAGSERGLGVETGASPSSSAPTFLVSTANAPFWSSFVVSSEPDWVEGQPTLRQLSDSADAVVIGRVVYFESNEVRTAEEASSTELTLGIEVMEQIRGSAGSSTLELTALPASFVTSELPALQAKLPSDPALLLLRKRQDGSFRVVNGYGISGDDQSERP